MGGGTDSYGGQLAVPRRRQRGTANETCSPSRFLPFPYGSGARRTTACPIIRDKGNFLCRGVNAEQIILFTTAERMVVQYLSVSSSSFLESRRRTLSPGHKNLDHDSHTHTKKKNLSPLLGRQMRQRIGELLQIVVA